ncbi:MOSC domain-containing protein [Actinoplanes sp. ATCC 53533]|uniref:MOSC domain-containing protein n=1 Tax=Actinoplanes sp. ATCC 53533 TaxID=1288362 RepID=UPI001F4631C4|nr:MOSC domain-containing protein [Actinoplanes sp. ATCC 53533]
MADMPKIVALWRFPLKSALGESLGAVEVEKNGLQGDRAWACIDDEDGMVGSAKHPRRWGRLLEVGTSLRRDELTVHVGGVALRAGSAAADAALTTHLGRPVRLSRTAPDDPRLHRVLPDDPGLVPEWMAGVGPGDETVSSVGGVGRLGRFADFGAVHIVTTGELARLGALLGGPAVAAARFRPNLVLDLPRDPEPGEELRLGDVVLRVDLPTPRCVVPGLGHGELPADRSVLGALARHYRIQVPDLGRAACFGAYADVVRPGRLRVGQLMH